MSQFSAFVRRLIEAVGLVPVVGPIFRLLWSRKTAIAAVLTYGILEILSPTIKAALPPELANELIVLVADLVATTVTVGFVWASVILGIAIEDAAAKGS